jgi:hypothetical protein
MTRKNAHAVGSIIEYWPNGTHGRENGEARLYDVAHRAVPTRPIKKAQNAWSREATRLG